MDKIYDLTVTDEVKTEEKGTYDFKIIPEKPETKREPNIKSEDVSVSCFVLLVDSKEMNCKDGSFNIDILGNSMFEYVVRACPTRPACIRFEEGNNIIQTIRPYIKDTEYSLVLYSDTPLMTRANVMNILSYAKTKGLNVLKLTRGWVFNNEYIRHADEIYAPSTYYFEEEDFMSACNFKQLYIVAGVLKNRIISYHMRSGVYFKDPDTTYVEANVSIGARTVVEPYVSLCKNTIIEENAYIGARSSLVNARIYEGAKIYGAYIDGGIVMQNATVKNGAKIYSQTAIKEGAEVGEECIISNAIIGEHSMVGKNTCISYLNCENNVTIGSSCLINGKADKAVKIKEGAVIDDFVTLNANSIIEKNQRVNGGGRVE